MANGNDLVDWVGKVSRASAAPKGLHTRIGSVTFAFAHAVHTVPEELTLRPFGRLAELELAALTIDDAVFLVADHRDPVAVGRVVRAELWLPAAPVEGNLAGLVLLSDGCVVAERAGPYPPLRGVLQAWLEAAAIEPHDLIK